MENGCSPALPSRDANRGGRVVPAGGSLELAWYPGPGTAVAGRKACHAGRVWFTMDVSPPVAGPLPFG